MNTEAQAVRKDTHNLAEDAQALLAATATVAGDKVREARERLTAALEHSKQTTDHLRHKAEEAAKAADKALHENPYPALAIAAGVGVLFGVLLGRK